MTELRIDDRVKVVNSLIQVDRSAERGVSHGVIYGVYRYRGYRCRASIVYAVEDTLS